MLRQIPPAICFIALTTLPVSAQQGAPELILHNGKVVTVNTGFVIAEAIAIRGERILRVGSNAEILALKGADTHTLDLEGKMVLPGLIDSHAHPLSASIVEFDHAIPQMDSIQDVLNYF